MTDLYLTWQPDRRPPWTEHNVFPHGAIRWWNQHKERYGWRDCPLHIYHLSDDRTTMRFIPPEEWEAK